MKNQDRSFKVNKLTFNNYSKQVKMEGVLFQDKFSFESKLLISLDYLNDVLNFIHRENPEIEIDELLVADELPNDEVYYSMDLESLNGKLSFDMLFDEHNYKLIRA